MPDDAGLAKLSGQLLTAQQRLQHLSVLLSRMVERPSAEFPEDAIDDVLAVSAGLATVAAATVALGEGVIHEPYTPVADAVFQPPEPLVARLRDGATLGLADLDEPGSGGTHHRVMVTARKADQSGNGAHAQNQDRSDPVRAGDLLALVLGMRTELLTTGVALAGRRLPPECEPQRADLAAVSAFVTWGSGLLGGLGAALRILAGDDAARYSGLPIRLLALPKPIIDRLADGGPGPGYAVGPHRGAPPGPSPGGNAIPTAHSEEVGPNSPKLEGAWPPDQPSALLRSDRPPRPTRNRRDDATAAPPPGTAVKSPVPRPGLRG